MQTVRLAQTIWLGLCGHRLVVRYFKSYSERVDRSFFRNTNKDKKPGPSSDGASYKSSKASGDMKKKGKHEPFAYVSINQKKGKKKSRGQFDNLIKAGKAGVLKGAKSKGLKGKKFKAGKSM